MSGLIMVLSILMFS